MAWAHQGSEVISEAADHLGIADDDAFLQVVPKPCRWGWRCRVRRPFVDCDHFRVERGPGAVARPAMTAGVQKVAFMRKP
jgi:hypothetical protein